MRCSCNISIVVHPPYWRCSLFQLFSFASLHSNIMRVSGAFVVPTAILVATSSAQMTTTAAPSSITVDSSVTSFPTATGDPCAVVNTLVSSFLAQRESSHQTHPV
jgi:hypothetical protein